MEHSIAGSLRVGDGEALIRFRFASASVDGDAPNAEHFVHPPHPTEIIRMQENGELYVHPSRLPLTTSVLATMITNQQVIFKHPKGLHGGWSERAWAKMKQLLGGIKRPRGQLSITDSAGPPEPPNTPPPPTPTDTVAGATVPSDKSDSDSSTSDKSSSDSSEDEKTDDKGQKENGKDANDKEGANPSDNKGKKENGTDANDTERDVLYWKQKYEDEKAERVRIEDELIATSSQYHHLEDEHARLTKENERLLAQLKAATMLGKNERKVRFE